MVDFKRIQEKWQKKWEEGKVFKVSEDAKKKKFYVLELYLEDQNQLMECLVVISQLIR